MLLGRRIAQRRHTLGFTLVEVLVSIIVIAIGLLGAAKMQALAVSSAAGAGKRSLAALEADSLAASMHVNHGFWQSGALTAPITVTSAGVANPVLGVPTDCTAGGSAPCTATQVAAFDLQNWAADLNALLPSPVGVVRCTAAVVGTPVTCTITISWNEKMVAINSQGAGLKNGLTATSKMAPDYTLYVEP